MFPGNSVSVTVCRPCLCLSLAVSAVTTPTTKTTTFYLLSYCVYTIVHHSNEREHSVFYSSRKGDVSWEFPVIILKWVFENQTVCCNGVSDAYPTQGCRACLRCARLRAHTHIQTHTHSCALQGDLSSTASPEGKLLWGSTICQLSLFISF